MSEEELRKQAKENNDDEEQSRITETIFIVFCGVVFALIILALLSSLIAL